MLLVAPVGIVTSPVAGSSNFKQLFFSLCGETGGDSTDEAWGVEGTRVVSEATNNREEGEEESSSQSDRSVEFSVVVFEKEEATEKKEEFEEELEGGCCCS